MQDQLPAHEELYTHAQLKDAYNQGYSNRASLGDERTVRHNEAVLEAMQKMQLELRAQGATQHLQSFAGEGSEKFRLWLQDLERTLTQLGGDDARARVLVLQTLSGPAADFATREIKKNNAITWKKLKEKLTERFSDLSDLTLARQKLRRMVQGKSESVQNFYERLLNTARIAYEEEKLDEDYIQQQLVENFLDGLTDDGMVRRLIRLKPATLDKALEHATAEQQAQKVFNLRRGHTTESEHTPMEVDVVSAPSEQLTTTLQGITETLVSMQQAIQTLVSNQGTQQPSSYGNQPRDAQGRFVAQSDVPQSRNRPQTLSNIECYNCRRLGHFASQCREPRRLYYRRNNVNQSENRPNYRQSYAQVVAQGFPKNE